MILSPLTSSRPVSVSAGPRSTVAAPAKVTLCICTFRRPELLRRLLEAAAKLHAAGQAFTLSCVIVDNDVAGSSRPIVEAFQRSSGIPTSFAVEPTRNFALVRNRAVGLATGDYIAFIDDDEVPVPEWLDRLLTTRTDLNADGVLGPVRPYFDTPPPSWIIKGKLCDRPIHPTGMVMPWPKCRSGNVLLKRSIFEQLQFDPAYATGGEDVDFFKRAVAAGHTFVWCEEAPAYELVPPERCRKSYFLKRALLQGRISLKYSADKLTFGARTGIGVKAFVALSVYTLALPFLAFGGFHLVMRYLIKSCHHLGRLFAVANVELIRHRNF